MDIPKCEELFPNWENVNSRLKAIVNNHFRFKVDWAIYDDKVYIGFIDGSIQVFIPSEYRVIFVNKYNEFANTVIIESGMMNLINDKFPIIISEPEMNSFKCQLELLLHEYEFAQHRTLKDIFLRDYLGIDIVPELVFRLGING